MPFLNLSNAEFAPLFQLLENYEPHRTCPTKNTRTRRTFYAPAFDVREVSDSYYLDGELPGVDQNAIDIEFRDPQTLVIKGRSERNYQTTQPESSSDSEEFTKLRQPTVEDEDESDSNDSDTNTATSSGSTKTPTPTQTPTSKYWASERSIGDFERTFSFPSRVDQDAVRASLKNGVLSVVLPKEATPVAKKIRVE
ncbi:uncharacterized protein N7483_013006 [Penicillium malachiteum]|uniref:uncharacterized protein n=1 Tax=Penicillium malachiteum TaxID=1324776 RepID=UPI0025468175|nr:uncharacterized protein N7483_013006 [Penicillium malachiteum]KAJ5715825.1 hypothetical protein N7483_013006 [Penicillium malachiteum]